MTGQLFWTYWYFHVPNYVAALLAYTLIGRFLLSFAMPLDSANYIWRFFRRLTDWLVVAVSWITPLSVPPRLLPLAAAFWLFVLRAAFAIILHRHGLLPPLVAS